MSYTYFYYTIFQFLAYCACSTPILLLSPFPFMHTCKLHSFQKEVQRSLRIHILFPFQILCCAYPFHFECAQKRSAQKRSSRKISSVKLHYWCFTTQKAHICKIPKRFKRNNVAPIKPQPALFSTSFPDPMSPKGVIP